MRTAAPSQCGQVKIVSFFLFNAIAFSVKLCTSSVIPIFFAAETVIIIVYSDITFNYDV